jgi:hypothetical protein
LAILTTVTLKDCLLGISPASEYFNTQTPGKYPEDNLSLQQHGESLKTGTLTLSSKSNVLPEDGVTAPKHVGAVLMLILVLFLRQSLVHQLVNKINLNITAAVTHSDFHSLAHPTPTYQTKNFTVMYVYYMCI